MASTESETPTRDVPPFLLIGGTHGIPSTQARFARLTEIARELALRNHPPDVVLLGERILLPFEDAQVDVLRRYSNRVEIIDRAEAGSLVRRSLAWLKGKAASSKPVPLGSERDCPASFLKHLSQRYADCSYICVIVSGVRLAPALDLFPQAARLIDVERLGFDQHLEHKRIGRADGFAEFHELSEELELLKKAQALFVTSQRDAARLRDLHIAHDFLYLPPSGIVGSGVPPVLRLDQPVPPLEAAPVPKPSRILFVGSETPANLDGIRWFRRSVFPRIRRSAPACRLRIVGEAARQIEAGSDVDRIGWVGDLEAEYRDATVVVLPLRVGRTLRRRAVEALLRGKTLALTSAASYGLPVEHGKSAIVADEADRLAVRIADAVNDESLRARYEHGARTLSAVYFSLERTFGLPARYLGLPPKPVVKPKRKATAVEA